jgi:tight adherence protein B
MLVLFSGIFVLIVCFGCLLIALTPTKLERRVRTRFGKIALPDFVPTTGDPTEELIRKRRVLQWTWLAKVLDRYYFYQHVQRLVDEADLNISASMVIAVSLLSVLVIFAAAYICLFPLLLTGIVAIVAGALPYGYVRLRRRLRVRAFDRGLGEAIGVISRCLQAGQSLAGALEIVSTQAPAPVCDEFFIVHQQLLMGGDFKGCFIDMQKRIDSADLRFLVAAMLVQRDTGGNLIDVLEQAQEMIRERMKLKGDLAAKTAQGRLTGLILALLPFVLGLMMSLMSPHYLTPLLDTVMGHHAIYGALVMESIGAFFIYRLTQIEI